jgi:hypothetical protein
MVNDILNVLRRESLVLSRAPAHNARTARVGYLFHITNEVERRSAQPSCPVPSRGIIATSPSYPVRFQTRRGGRRHPRVVSKVLNIRCGKMGRSVKTIFDMDDYVITFLI